MAASSPIRAGSDALTRMVSGILLAAGTSARMGTRVKQLLPFRGRPLLQHAIDGAAAAPLDELIVVLGHRSDEVRGAIAFPEHARSVINPEYAAGQASSLRTGLAAAAADAEMAVILLGDQPRVPPSAVRLLLDLYASSGKPAIRSIYDGVPGHPVLLHRRIWPALLRLHGDAGAGPLLAEHPEWVAEAPLSGPPPIEVDTPADYRALLDADEASGPAPP